MNLVDYVLRHHGAKCIQRQYRVFAIQFYESGYRDRIRGSEETDNPYSILVVAFECPRQAFGAAAEPHYKGRSA